MSISKNIDSIMDKYYDYTEEYYYQFRYEGDDDEIEIDIKDEIEKYLKSKGVEYQIEIEDGYDSSSYENSFMAVAWIEDGKLNLKTVLLEVM